MTNNPARLATHVAGIPACKAGQTCIYWFLILFPGWCILASRRAIGHWLILLLLSVLFSSLLLRIHLPAALLLGPLIAGLILSLRGVKLSIPRPCYLAAQAIVGCMIARAINPSVFGVLFNNWALVLAILLTTLAISGLTGWLLVRYSALPGATGAWEALPAARRQWW